MVSKEPEKHFARLAVAGFIMVVVGAVVVVAVFVSLARAAGTNSSSVLWVRCRRASNIGGAGAAAQNPLTVRFAPRSAVAAGSGFVTLAPSVPLFVADGVNATSCALWFVGARRHTNATGTTAAAWDVGARESVPLASTNVSAGVLTLRLGHVGLPARSQATVHCMTNLAPNPRYARASRDWAEARRALAGWG